MKIGDEVYIHGYVDEIRKDTIIIRNKGGYFGTVQEEVVPSAQPPWIPIKWHYITDEEREREGYPKDWVYYLDCEMPEDEQEILVTTKNGYVEKDVCCIDDGYGLDSGWDWRENVVAWMPLPEPYKEVRTNESNNRF